MGFIKKVFTGLMILIVSSVLSGCTVLVVGAVAGTGAYVWTQGNLELTVDHTAEDLYAATREALDELNILVERDHHDRFGASISARMNEGSKVMIKVVGITEYKAKIRVRVGVLGNLKSSQMIMNMILGKV